MPNVVYCRIQKDLVDPEKLQLTLADETLNQSCNLKRALEMVALLEAQMKEMNPNLDSISEYCFPYFCSTQLNFIFLWNFAKPISSCYRYRKKVELYNERVEDLTAVTQQRDDIKKHYDELRKRRQVFQCILLATSSLHFSQSTLSISVSTEM